MRESDKKVYLLDLQETPEEFVLYDFSRPDTAIVSGPDEIKTFEVSGVVEINGKPCRLYKDTEQYDYFNWGYLVESVGLVSHFDGDLIHPRWARVAGGEYYYGLDHIEDMADRGSYQRPCLVVLNRLCQCQRQSPPPLVQQINKARYSPSQHCVGRRRGLS